MAYQPSSASASPREGSCSAFRFRAASRVKAVPGRKGEIPQSGHSRGPECPREEEEEEEEEEDHVVMSVACPKVRSAPEKRNFPRKVLSEKGGGRSGVRALRGWEVLP